MQRKIPSILLTLALTSILFVTFATAKIDIVYPSSEYYAVGNTSLTIRWTADDPEEDPTSFQVYIRNPKISTLGGHSLANNVPTAKEQVTVWFLQDFLSMSGDVTDGFIIFFTKLDDIEVVYAESEPFEVKEPGTEPAEFKEDDDESEDGEEGDGDDDDEKEDDEDDKESGVAGVFKGVSLSVVFIAVTLASILI